MLLVGGNEATMKELSQILSSEEKIKIVGEIRINEETLAEARKLSPDVVIMLTDISMSGINIIGTAQAITESLPPARMILITDDFNRDLVPAVKIGAAALLSRNTTRDELMFTINNLGLLAPSSTATAL